MLTEDEARDLLAKAAVTIDVGPGTPLAEPGRRLWPALAAAAAVIAVVAGVAVAVRDSSDAPPPADPPDVVDTARSIPSVFGYDRLDAYERLEAVGLVVNVEERFSCSTENRAAGTRPDTGSVFRPGDAVTLLVTERSIPGGPEVSCPAPDDAFAWQLLDFANGRGAAPEFAEEVTLYVDGMETVTLTGDEARHPTAWGDPSVLTELRTASAVTDGPSTPYLKASIGAVLRDRCGGVSGPAGLDDRQAQSFSIGIPTDGIVRCDVEVDLYLTGGVIDTVSTYTQKSPVAQATWTRVPNVVGLSRADAVAELEGDGFVVETTTVDLPPCHDDELVLAQEPLGNKRAASGSVVRIDVNIRGDDRCAGLPSTGPDLQRIAQRFVMFARGERDELPVDRGGVDLYLGNAIQATITSTEAQDESAWAVCRTRYYSERECPFSAIQVLTQYAGPVAVSAVITSICPEQVDQPRVIIGSAARVVISPAAVDSCQEDFAVQVFANDAGQITAVNLLLGSP